MADPPKMTGQPSPDRPLDDNRPLVQAVVDLHIARRTLLIYPANHSQVKRSVVKAYKQVADILGSQETLTLTAMEGELQVGSRQLKTRNPVSRELALDFKRYGIAVVKFHKGIEIKELGRFLQLLTLDSDKVAARGGLSAVAAMVKLPHIAIQAVDYSQLQLTEEKEIRRSAEGGGSDSTWQQFVTHLLEQVDGQGAPPGHSVTGPTRLATLLNEQRLSVDTAVDQYGSLVEAALGHGAGSQPLSEALAQFQQLIRELHPELQEQFLTATFDRCGQSASMLDAANLVDGLGVDLIVRMLRQANSDGREISPSLMAFITKMGQADTTGTPPGARNTDGALMSDQVDALLTREEYENYVDEGYAKLLHALTQQGQAEQEESWSVARKVELHLTDAHIQSHVGRAIEHLMVTSADTAAYRDWARQLAYLLDDLLDSGAYAYLAELMASIRREQAGADTDRAAIAGLVMDRFTDPQFIATAIEKVRHSMDQIVPEALVFLMELGEPVVVEIFDGLDPDLTLYDQGVLSQILENLSSLTAREALARIKDPRPEYVRRMIRIIRRLGDSQKAESIRPLMNHDDVDVRIEALAALLHFRNKWGLMRLREYLEGPWSTEAARAFDLAGKFAARDVVPLLITIADGRGDVERRAAALRALGRIGDSSAIPVLSTLVRSRWHLFSKQSLQLKSVVFETLAGYPPAEVKDLLHFGLQQKNDRIRFACENTLREMSRAARNATPDKG
jgi:hypothetical protein